MMYINYLMIAFFLNGFSDEVYLGEEVTIDLATKEIVLNDSSCLGWDIENKSLINLLDEFELVSPSEWGALCYYSDCNMVFNGWLKGVPCRIEINPGSYILLMKGEDVKYYIKKKASKYFIQPCNCCE
jgi:hypothetical protein